MTHHERIAWLTRLRDGYSQKKREGSADGYWDHLQADVDALDDIIAAIEQAEAQLAALEQQIGEVYALARGPIEQARAIPLGQWVKTRFVHIEDFNEQILSREDREKAWTVAFEAGRSDQRGEINRAKRKNEEARRLLRMEDGQ